MSFLLTFEGLLWRFDLTKDSFAENWCNHLVMTWTLIQSPAFLCLHSRTTLQFSAIVIMKSYFINLLVAFFLSFAASLLLLCEPSHFCHDNRDKKKHFCVTLFENKKCSMYCCWCCCCCCCCCCCSWRNVETILTRHLIDSIFFAPKWRLATIGHLGVKNH